MPVTEVLEERDPESKHMDAFAEEMPYETIVAALDEKLRVCDTGMNAVIARAVCSMMVRRYPDVPRALASGTVISKPAGMMRAVRRAIDLLRACTNSRDEMVRFFAAKGLWEAYQGLAAQPPRRLKVSGGADLVKSVDELLEVWNIA